MVLVRHVGQPLRSAGAADRAARRHRAPRGRSRPTHGAARSTAGLNSSSQRCTTSRQIRCSNAAAASARASADLGAEVLGRSLTVGSWCVERNGLHVRESVDVHDVHRVEQSAPRRQGLGEPTLHSRRVRRLHQRRHRRRQMGTVLQPRAGPRRLPHDRFHCPCPPPSVRRPRHPHDGGFAVRPMCHRRRRWTDRTTSVLRLATGATAARLAPFARQAGRDPEGSRSGGGVLEVRVVQPHAVAAHAGRLPREAPFGVGRHRPSAVRPGRGPSRVPRVHGPARVRGLARLRRHRRQRAPSERLRPDAVAQHHRRRARPPDVEGGDLRHRQLDRAVQPADPGGRGIRDARRDLGRPAGRRLPGRHVDGHELLLRPDPGAHPRQVRGEPRADHAGVARDGAVRVRREVQPAPLRELLAEADPEAAPADLHPGRRLDRDVGLLRRARVQLLVPLLRRLPAPARRCSTATGSGWRTTATTSRRTAPRSRRRSASPTPTRRPRSSTPSTSSTSTTGASTCIPAFADAARLPHDQHPQGGRAEPAHRGGAAAVLVAHVEGPRRGRPRHRRLPGHGARAHGGHDQGPPHRHRVRPVPRRQHARLEDAPLDASSSPRR